MKRIINSEKYLKNVVNPKQRYYIGFGIKELTSLGENHPDVKLLIQGLKSNVIISGKSGALKENTSGKYVRKQPEQKESIWRHIEYYSHKWSKEISYDREYFIWEKELLHKFSLELSALKSPQGELILVFPIFIMEDSQKHYLLAKAAMNMAYALSKYFLIYDEKLEPIIPVTKYENRNLLSPGFTFKTVSEKLEHIQFNLESNDNMESEGNSYRFAVLKEYTPSDVTIGTGGFDEYLIFEYKERNLLIFENLKTGNATYIFKLSKFDFKKTLDKQTAIHEPGFIKRIIHESMDSWNTQLKRFF